MAGELRFSLLGGLRITLKEGEAEAPLPGLSTQKGQALLCYLALTRRPQTRDTLASLLWSDDPQEEARDSLRHVLLVLRKAASPYLLITRDTVAFNTERPYWLDVDVFRDKFATANRALPADDPASAVALREAMDLYKGELFEGFYLPRAALFEEWVLTERQLLHGMAIEALHRLAGASIRQGNAAEAITYLSRLLVLEPWREEASRDLMRLLAETGQRSAAVAQYEACRRILLAELGVEPGVETVALYGQILAGKITPGVSGIAPPTPKPAPRPPNNLPAALTSLLGRDTELTQLVDRLQRPDVRLLTLVGEGGIGKTRLATELASRLLPAFPDGVFVVSLAALHDAELVPSAIGQVLKIQEGQDQSYLDVLKAWLAERRVLLVLDNFEQLLDGASTVAELLEAAPDLKLLVTSREPLATIGEHVFPVQPLPVPLLGPVGSQALESLEQFSSIGLFCARAEAVRYGFALSADNAPSITEICRQLDGSPLGIELAAAQSAEYEVDEISRRLNDRFRFLVRGNRAALPRHQTLRACIEWGYDLLSEQDRALFRSLSVFAGGWTLEGAGALCAGTMDDSSRIVHRPSSIVSSETHIADGIHRLVAKSLVVLDSETGRYRMHESIRQYAADMLEEAGEAEAVGTLHMRYFTALAETAWEPMRGAKQAEWLARLEAEHDNFRAALRRARESGRTGTIEAVDPVESGMRMVAVLWWFWYVRGYYSEGMEQLKSILDFRFWILDKFEQSKIQNLKSKIGQALNGTGVLAWRQADYPLARSLFEESLVITRESGDKRGIAAPLGNLALLAYSQGDYETARPLFEECLAIYREMGDRVRAAGALENLGVVAHGQGDYASARPLFEESLAIQRELGDKIGMASSLTNLGILTYEQGDYATARPLHEESLAVRRELGNKRGIAAELAVLGYVTYRQGDYAVARSLFEESLAIRRELGDNFGVVKWLVGLGRVAAGMGQQEGQAELGAKLLGAAEAWLEASGRALESEDRRIYAKGVASAHAQLSEEAFERAWAQGRAMSIEQAMKYALDAVIALPIR